jgi:hypothetical protein
MQTTDTNSQKRDFEELWDEAHRAPKTKTVDSDNKIVIDLSIDTILDQYVAFAKKGVKEKKISKNKLTDLIEKTDGYKKALLSIDDGEFLDDVRKFAKRLSPFS